MVNSHSGNGNTVFTTTYACTVVELITGLKNAQGPPVLPKLGIILTPKNPTLTPTLTPKIPTITPTLTLEILTMTPRILTLTP